MRKLLQLKNWLTIEEATRHLSVLFEERVSEADVLRLALDRHIKLSVNFVNPVDARPGKVVSVDKSKSWAISRDSHGIFQIETDYEKTDPSSDIGNLLPSVSPENAWICSPLWPIYCGAMGIDMPDDTMLKFAKDVRSLKGVYDLPMLGAEVLDVENRYQMLTGGPVVTKASYVGAFVVTEAEHFYELQVYADDNNALERPWNYRRNLANFSPAESLPSDAILVVRTSELAAFDGSKEKSLSNTERDSLLKLVIGMAEKGYGYNPNEKRSDVVPVIVRDLEILGISMTDDTVRKYLKQASKKLPPLPPKTFS
jgi:hypothetical protein